MNFQYSINQIMKYFVLLLILIGFIGTAFAQDMGNISDPDLEYTRPIIRLTDENIIPPPLKQFKAGIPIDEITCKEGLQLIFKSSVDSPACVKPETKTKLIERGWIKTELSVKTNSQSIFLEGFQNSYNINDSIKFTLVFKSGQKCGTIELSLMDTKTSEFVNGIGFDDMCDSPYLSEDLRISIPYQGDNSPFKTDKIGSYKIVITNEGEVMLEKEFVVKNADQS